MSEKSHFDEPADEENPPEGEARGETNESKEIENLRNAFKRLFSAAAKIPQGKEALEPKAFAEFRRSFHGALKGATKSVTESAGYENGEVRVRGLLIEDQLQCLHEIHNIFISERDDLTPQTKDKLKTPEKRRRFRIGVFNRLCHQSKLGLGPQNKFPTDGITDEEFKKRLGKYWRLFDYLCSSYDGGNINRALTTAIYDTQNTLPKTVINRFENRSKVRGKLFNSVSRRLKKDVKDIYTRDMQRWETWTKVCEEIADIGLKGGAAALLAASGIGYFTVPAAGLLWSLRGISEGLGYDFGNVLAKGATFPFRRLKSAPVAVPRASMNLTDRIKLFFRGLIPVLPALTALPKIGVKIEKIVPGSNLEPGEMAVSEREHAAQDISEAIQHVLDESNTHH